MMYETMMKMCHVRLLNKYKNGNHTTEIYSDGTRIRETIDPDANHFEYDFAENFDIKISDYCPVGCKYCHESSTPYGKHGDILGLPFIDTLQAGTEVAIGGGSALSHPDLIPFLEKLKRLHVIANLTVNQKELILPSLKEKMSFILNNGLVNGVGVSLTDSSTFNDIVDEVFGNYPNLVVHTIAGVFTEKDLPAVMHRKMLVLGYKDLEGRRAGQFYDESKDIINKNIQWFKENVKEISNDVKLMSFDCLGIRQVNPKKELDISEEDWMTLFQGDDYSPLTPDGKITASTFYCDAVTRTIGRSSTQPLNERLSFTDETAQELFQKSFANYKENGDGGDLK